MQIAILHNRVPDDASASDRDVLVQVAAVTAALDGLGHRSVAVECDLNLLSLQQRLRELRPDVVFNLVESLDGSDSLMFLVPALLDTIQHAAFDYFWNEANPANGLVNIYEGHAGGVSIGDINTDSYWWDGTNKRFIGSAIITSDQPIIAFVNSEKPVLLLDSMYTFGAINVQP